MMVSHDLLLVDLILMHQTRGSAFDYTSGSANSSRVEDQVIGCTPPSDVEFDSYLPR